MSEFKVIRETKDGVLVELLDNQKEFPCEICKFKYEDECPNMKETVCPGGRFLTEQEEQEYYSSKRV